MKLYHAGVFAAIIISGVYAENSKRYSHVAAILPFEIVNVQNEAGTEVARSIQDHFSKLGGLRLVSEKQVYSALEDSQVTTDMRCLSRSCHLAIGKYLRTDMVITGSVSKSGEQYGVSINALEISSNTSLWNREYRCASLSDVNDKLAAQIAADFDATLFGAPEAVVPLPEPESKIVEVTDNTPIPERELSYQVTAGDYGNGVVQGFTVGGNARWALGKLNYNESQWGAEVFAVMPVSKNSQVRARFGAPTSRSSSIVLNTVFENPDLGGGIEHELGWSHFGITYGAAYMHMWEFVQQAPRDSAYNFDTYGAYNWVFGIRGGRPHKGFRGRISYPMPFTIDNNDKSSNFFLEYSAFGMFGSERVKGGIGIQGSYKQRVSTDTVFIDTWDSYYDYATRSEMFVMVPCGRLAFLAGEHSVISLSLDIAGLILPRPAGNELWSPNIGVSYTFSLGPIKNVEIFDGRF